jgi:hypothetical protein
MLREFSFDGAVFRRVEEDLSEMCASLGFPHREPFQWSRGPELWMRA